MPRLDLLFAHAADLDVQVEYADLGPSLRGVYLDDAGLVLLNRRMTRAQATAALAHEVAHSVYGDRCSTEVIERRADELGASLIISREEYRDAEQMVGHHPGALAVELGVTPRLIHAWRRWVAKSGEPLREVAGEF